MQLPKESGAVRWSSQPLRGWQIDYIDPLLLSEGSKYTLVCTNTKSCLAQALRCHCTNQAATMRVLERLSIIYEYAHQMEVTVIFHARNARLGDKNEHDIK